MRRFEAAKTKDQKRAPKTLFELDYLLGVNDEARQGALRFSVLPDETLFLSPQGQMSIPPLVDLPKLLSATERFMADHESADDLRLLLAPGSSLGGARPKASIRDRDGTLAIAKFPRSEDEFNTVVWEAVTLTLAKRPLGEPCILVCGQEKIREEPECTQAYMRIPSLFLTNPETKRQRLCKWSKKAGISVPAHIV